MGMLFDRGLFKYEDKISKHWPEFGQNGKENITISDVLQHKSGLAWFTESIPTIKNAWPENIKKNQMGSFIEKQKQHFPVYEDIEGGQKLFALAKNLAINKKSKILIQSS